MVRGLYPFLRVNDGGAGEVLVVELKQQGLDVSSIDVATVAAHIRRSRLLYAKAFGGRARVGAIAIEDPGYDPDRWWRTSDGMREVPFEALAYLYARFFFAAD